MSVTSANTDDLTAFVDESGRTVARMDNRLTSIANLRRTVLDASSDFRCETASIDRVAELVNHWEHNARTVATIRDDLIAADVYDGDGNAVVDDAVVAQSLRSAGLTTAPGIIDTSPSEVFGIAPTSGFVDDPICLANGNFVLEEEDLPTYGLASFISVRRMYNSLDHRDGFFGPGWSSLLDTSLDVAEDRVGMWGPDGGSFVFRRRSDGDFTEDVRRRRQMHRIAGGWEVDEAGERRFTFDRDGVITGFSEGPSRVRFERDDTGCTVREVRSGRHIRYEIDPHDGYVSTVTASGGRRAVYERGADGQLRHVERDVGDITYEVGDTGLLTAATDEDGITVFRNTYDETGRVLTQVEQHGRETRYEYREDGVSTVTSTDGRPPNVMVHDRRGRMTAMIDGLGNVMRVAYGERDEITQIVDRTGAVTRYEHDGRGNVVVRIDPDGLQTRYGWDDRDRLVRVVDRAGAVLSHHYDGDLREPSRTRLPDGGEVVFHRDAIGLLTGVTDADGVTLGLRRDDEGDVTEVRDAGDAILVRLEHDGAGRVIAMSDGEGGRTVYERDPLGREIAVVDPVGNRTRFDHDAEGRIIATVDPAGNREVFERDVMGRVVAIIDAGGGRTSFTHHPNGELAARIDQEGRHWRHEIDALGRTRSIIDPSGAETRYRFSPTGQLLEETRPAGRRITIAHDQTGRPSSLTGPDGIEHQLDGASDPGGVGPLPESADGRTPGAHFRLDARGILEEAIDPAGIRTRFHSDRTGRLVGTITESVGMSYRWDGAGRLTGVTDPRGNTTELHRGALGEVRQIDSPDGSGLVFDRDVDGFLAAVRAIRGDAAI